MGDSRWRYDRHVSSAFRGASRIAFTSQRGGPQDSQGHHPMRDVATVAMEGQWMPGFLQRSHVGARTTVGWLGLGKAIPFIERSSSSF